MVTSLRSKYGAILVAFSIITPLFSSGIFANAEEELPVPSNEITQLDKSNQSLENFDASQYPELKILNISNNKIKKLDLSKNVILESLDCSNNQLEEIKLSDCLMLSDLKCENNCLPALDLSEFIVLEKCSLSNQKIILPKNTTDLNLKDKFPIIEITRVKNVSSKDGNINYDPNTSTLSGIKSKMEVTYTYETVVDDPSFNMKVTLSFTGEKDSTIQEPNSNFDPLPPFNPGNSSDIKPNVEDSGISMYRLYNPNTGEHHYTSDTNERDTLAKIGWNKEGIGWIAPEKVGQPVYRLYNPIVEGGEHHYTQDIKERDTLRILGWSYEDVGWLSADKKNGIPLYREYNPNQYSANHNYTLDKNEHDTLIKLGWKDEGLAWYGLKEKQ